MIHVLYDTGTGEITRVQTGPFVVTPEPGESALLSASPVSDATHYVDVNADPVALVPKPLSGVSIDVFTVPADGATKITASGIPNPAQATLSGPDTFIHQIVEDGVLEITFISPGTYSLRIESITEQALETVLEAT